MWELVRQDAYAGIGGPLEVVIAAGDDLQNLLSLARAASNGAQGCASYYVRKKVDAPQT